MFTSFWKLSKLWISFFSVQNLDHFLLKDLGTGFLTFVKIIDEQLLNLSRPVKTFNDSFIQTCPVSFVLCTICFPFVNTGSCHSFTCWTKSVVAFLQRFTSEYIEILFLFLAGFTNPHTQEYFYANIDQGPIGPIPPGPPVAPGK